MIMDIYYGGKAYIALKKYIYLPIKNEELEYNQDSVRVVYKAY
jgi:hypothetical protein